MLFRAACGCFRRLLPPSAEAPASPAPAPAAPGVVPAPGAARPRTAPPALPRAACGCFRLAALLAACGCAAALDLTQLEEGTTAELAARGNLALAEGKYETAIDHYRKALAIDKDYFQALFNLALALQQTGKLADAKRWYEDALRVRRDHPEVLCNLGVIAFRTGDFDAAALRFQEAARLSTGEPQEAADYWFNVGTARERLQQWAEAQRAYEECLALNARHYGGHFNLGTLYLGALAEEPRALDRARDHLGQARDLAPNRAEAWLNLAVCFERQRAPADAEAAFAEAIKVASGPLLNRAYWQRACWYDRCVPPRKLAMRDDLRRILDSDPDYAEANGKLGSYFFAVADYDQAIHFLEREVEGEHFDPRSQIDLEAHYLLALIYTDHRPDPGKAVAHASVYYQNHPDSRKIHELRRRAFRLVEPMLPPPKAVGRGAAGHAAPADGAAPAATPASGHAPAPADAHAPAAHAPAPADAHSPAAPAPAPAPTDAHSPAPAPAPAPAAHH